jgi:beta-lactamase class A
MSHSRREFLKTAAASATIAASPLARTAATIPSTPVEQAPQSGLITSLFSGLPGQVAFKIFAPAVGGQPGFTVSSNSSKQLFVASAIKTYVLCEALRQVDAPNVDEVLDQTKLTLDSTVWSFGSPTFIPEKLSGIVSERTTMEAMITRSDNTATDMMFKQAGANHVRAFVSSIGLKNTLIPDSTRAVTAYVFGAPN